MHACGALHQILSERRDMRLDMCAIQAARTEHTHAYTFPARITPLQLPSPASVRHCAATQQRLVAA
jgi:hypothetical protein